MNKPVAMTIAGSDNSAGAGIQADLKTFSAMGVFGVTCVTCVVAENPAVVRSVQSCRPSVLADQIATSLEYFPVAAAKTGMLYSTPLIETVHQALAGARFPVVVDPVMVATSGGLLLRRTAIEALRRLILPNAALVTPNLAEAEVLAGRAITTLKDAEDAVRRLHGLFGVPFLVKGGHLRTAAATDFLYDGRRLRRYTAGFIKGIETHGTGCTYSAAVTAGLAFGLPLPQAVAKAKKFITSALRGSLRWPRRRFALEHFFQA